MSIDATKLVWAHSLHSATQLNAMLALADVANHEGYCWPSIKTLAAMCRCSERQMTRIIAGLEESGELYTERGVGRKNTTRYLITIGANTDDLSRRMVHYFGYSPAEAIRAAEAHLQKGDIWRKKVTPATPLPPPQKGDIPGENLTPATPFSEEGKGDISGEKVTSEVEKVTSSAGKGDIAMSPDPLDPAPDPSNATRATPPALPANNQPAPAPTPTPTAVPAHDDYSTVRTLYENEFGLLTPIIAAAIKDQLRACPAGWIPKAIEIAVKRGNRKWSYVEGILRRWHADGFDGDQDNYAAAKPKGQGGKSAGYGRQVAAPKEKTNEYENDPEYLDFLASFVDARDGSRLAAD